MMTKIVMIVIMMVVMMIRILIIAGHLRNKQFLVFVLKIDKVIHFIP